MKTNRGRLSTGGRLLLALWALLTGAPAQAQRYYDFLPDSLARHLLRRQGVRQLTATAEAQPPLSRATTLRFTFDRQGRLLLSSGTVATEWRERRYDAAGHLTSLTLATPAFNDTLAAVAARVNRHYGYDPQGRLQLELRPRFTHWRDSQQVARLRLAYDTLTRYRYEQAGDTSWQFRTAGGVVVLAQRTCWDEQHRLFRSDRLRRPQPRPFSEDPPNLMELESHYVRYDAQGRAVEWGGLLPGALALRWPDQRMNQGLGFAGGILAYWSPPTGLRGPLRPGPQPRAWARYRRRRLLATWAADQREYRRYHYSLGGQLRRIEQRRQLAAADQPGEALGTIGLEWAAGLPVRVVRHNAQGGADQVSTYTYERYDAAPSAH